jgi:hypothetical protein
VKRRFLVPDSRSAGRFFVACEEKLQGIATRRKVIWSLRTDPLVGSVRGDEDESGPPEAMVAASFLPLAWALMPKTSFRKNSGTMPPAIT